MTVTETIYYYQATSGFSAHLPARLGVEGNRINVDAGDLFDAIDPSLQHFMETEHRSRFQLVKISEDKEAEVLRNYIEAGCKLRSLPRQRAHN
jgi:hypothetical protein